MPDYNLIERLGRAALVLSTEELRLLARCLSAEADAREEAEQAEEREPA